MHCSRLCAVLIDCNTQDVDEAAAFWGAALGRAVDLEHPGTRGNYRDGPMQDVHWPEALFGYFPCYSLGAMYAAYDRLKSARDIAELGARAGCEFDKNSAGPVLVHTLKIKD